MKQEKAPSFWLLRHCHARALEHLHALQQLAARPCEGGGDPATQRSAQCVLHFFDTDAPLHRVLEEQELFPALLESMAGSDAVCLRNLTDGLAAEHRALAQLWLALRPAVAALSQGESGVLDATQVGALAELATRHFGVKDKELLPMAERLLQDEDILRFHRDLARGLGL